MKSFKQFCLMLESMANRRSFIKSTRKSFNLLGTKHFEESVQPPVTHNATMAKLKSLAKNSHYKSARFVFHPSDKGRISAGDAYDTSHAELGDNYRHNTVPGYVHHHKDTDSYSTRFYVYGGRKDIENKLKDRFKTHGIEHSTKIPPEADRLFDEVY